MPKQLSINEINKKLSKYDIILVGNYINCRTNTRFKCYCGNLFDARPEHIFRGATRSCGCFRYLTIEEVNNRISKYNLVLIDEYINASTKTRFKCYCGVIFSTLPFSIFEGKTTSCGCYQKSQAKKQHSGINNINYNPNLTAQDRISRRELPEFRKWRDSIYIRDNYTCQICGTKKSPFNAHHLDGYHWCKERRFDLTNGITLCEKCHMGFHLSFGYKNNTEEQFEEFKIRR